MHTLALSGLTGLDWGVLGVYAALLVGVGAWASRLVPTNAGEYFLSARAMPVWAVAISILATAQSAATFTGVPELSFTGSLVYIGTSLGGIVAALILARAFIPAYYRLGVSTPYQLLETRFGPGAKLASSWAYMVGRVFASGSRVYVGAIPVSFAVFGDASPEHLAVAIAGFMAFGILYTLVGGITSVIWTDVFQVSVYLGAAVVAIVLLASKVTAPVSEVLAALNSGMPDGGSKLTVLRLGIAPFDPAEEMTLLTILTGFVLLTLASHGTDQDLVQRMLTCKDGRAGSRSVIAGMLVGIPAVAIFLVLGLLLWVFYQRPDLMGGEAPAARPGSGGEVLLTYILNEMPAGAAGLMIAGVLAAGPAGINSGLNSMASTFVSDVYTPWKPGRSARHTLIVGRLAVVVWGVVMGAFALACIWWQQASGLKIIPFVLSVMSFAYAGLLGVFLTALFTRRGTTASAIAALAAGFVTVAALRPEVWAQWTAAAGLPDAWVALRLAFPWQLVIGTLVATAVCALPRGSGRERAWVSGGLNGRGGA